MLGRSVTQIDDALSQYDTAGGAIGQIGALCRNLRGEAEGVRRARAGDLHLRAGLARQCLRDIVRGRRKRTKLRMNLREVVQASRQAAELSILDQSGKGLVDRRRVRPRPGSHWA